MSGSLKRDGRERSMVTEVRKLKDEERKERTREGLLDAAARVFARQGYHPTLISDIVTEAGVGQGTFYRHFPDKRSVFGALFDRLVSQVIFEVGRIAEALPQDADQYREVSVRVVAATAGVLRSNQGLVQLFLREGPSVDREFDARLEEIYEQLALLAAGFLEHAVSHGFARPCHTYLVGHMLVGAGTRLMQVFFDGHLDDIGVEGSVREAVDLAFFGFGPTPPRHEATTTARKPNRRKA